MQFSSRCCQRLLPLPATSACLVYELTHQLSSGEPLSLPPLDDVRASGVGPLLRAGTAKLAELTTDTGEELMVPLMTISGLDRREAKDEERPAASSDAPRLSALVSGAEVRE